MYTAHFNLERKPFQISSDAGFIWLGEKHKEGLATLRYGILDNKGFLVLTGDVGTGKTTLINALMGSLSNDVVCASVPDPSLDKLDFLNYIAAAFGINEDFSSKGKFLAHFTSFLRKAHLQNKKVLLIIDEAQLLTQELLEEIRLLSNIVTQDSSPLLNIFFVGQYEFNEIITRPENRAIAQRITLNYYIEPLSVEETGEYIRHRLKIAGTTEEIFTSSAIEDVYDFSKGFPRKINVICDHCLMSAYADDKTKITSEIVKESSRELEIPLYRWPRVDENPVPIPEPQPVVFEPVVSEPSPPVAAPPEVVLPSPEKKTALSWPLGLFLFVVVLFIAFGSFFLYYTNERYQESTARFLSIQEKIGLYAGDQKGKESPSVVRNSPVSPGTETAPKATASPASEATADPTIELAPSLPIAGTAATPVGPGSESKKIEKISRAMKKKIGSPGAQPVVSQPESSATHSFKDAQDTKTVDPIPALPEQPVIIRFKHDSNLFSLADIDSMKEFAKILRLYPETVIHIAGYTDSSGSEEYNRKLSGFRANIVKSFLMGQDIAPEQMQVEGLGNTNPIADNSTEKGRVENRRVEISVVAGK